MRFFLATMAVIFAIGAGLARGDNPDLSRAMLYVGGLYLIAAVMTHLQLRKDNER